MLAKLAYRTADRLVRLLPRLAADALATALARTAFALRVPARASAEANLARLLPHSDAPSRRRLARRSFEHFALGFTDFLRQARLTPAELVARVDVEGRSHLDAARASGRGVILLSAHLGNWEWGAAYLGSAGVPVHLAARPHAAGVEAVFAARRAGFGVAALPPRALFSNASRALRRGEWVALMGDRSADPLAARGSVCAWVALLAQRTGALVLPAIMVRAPHGRYSLVLDAPLSPQACREGGYRELMRRWLERFPDQWAAFEPLPDGIG